MRMRMMIVVGVIAAFLVSAMPLAQAHDRTKLVLSTVDSYLAFGQGVPVPPNSPDGGGWSGFTGRADSETRSLVNQSPCSFVDGSAWCGYLMQVNGVWEAFGPSGGPVAGLYRCGLSGSWSGDWSVLTLSWSGQCDLVEGQGPSWLWMDIGSLVSVAGHVMTIDDGIFSAAGSRNYHHGLECDGSLVPEEAHRDYEWQYSAPFPLRLIDGHVQTAESGIVCVVDAV